jgi:hypothetical protein
LVDTISREDKKLIEKNIKKASSCFIYN